MKTKRELLQEYRALRVNSKHADKYDAHVLLAEIGRRAKTEKAEADKQQLKLF